jgi:hypothetical protein
VPLGVEVPLVPVDPVVGSREILVQRYAGLAVLLELPIGLSPASLAGELTAIHGRFEGVIHQSAKMLLFDTDPLDRHDSVLAEPVTSPAAITSVAFATPITLVPTSADPIRESIRRVLLRTSAHNERVSIREVASIYGEGGSGGEKRVTVVATLLPLLGALLDDRAPGADLPSLLEVRNLQLLDLVGSHVARTGITDRESVKQIRIFGTTSGLIDPGILVLCLEAVAGVSGRSEQRHFFTSDHSMSRMFLT